jgi:FkbM family methyltransferase
VGANRGDWTKTALRYFPHARFTLFEPQDDLLRGGDLDGDARVNICAMGAGPNTATMKLSKHERDDSFSFALSERQAIELGREQIDAPVVALDEFLARQGLPLPDLLKIDAEGWDLEVLKGAEKCVNNADVILLEAAVMNKAFTNTIANVITEMDRQDFMLFDVTDLNRTKRHGVLWLVELAFVRKRGQLAMAVDSYT